MHSTIRLAYISTEPGAFMGLDSPNPLDRRRLAALLTAWESRGFEVVPWQAGIECDVIYIVSLPHVLDEARKLLRAPRKYAVVAGVVEDPFFWAHANCMSDDLVDLKKISFFGSGWRGMLRKVRWGLAAGRLGSDARASLFGLIRRCDAIVTSSDGQASMIRQLNVFAEGIADCMPTAEFGHSTCEYDERVPVRIVWEGTGWGLQLLELVRPALEAAHRRSVIPVEFLLVTDRVRPSPLFGLNDNKEILASRYRLPTRYEEWNAKTLGELIRSAGIGIAPMPLRNPFYLNKAWSKPLAYMACGVPVVASPIPSYRALIRDGIDGLLARNTQEWTEALLALIASPDLRRRIGQAGKRRLEEVGTAEIVAEKFADVFKEAVRLHNDGARKSRR